MHIFFSGIGGTGIGPLALVAKQTGHTVSGSDKQDSLYIEYLRNHGITDIHIGQSREQIEASHHKEPIDWFVYSTAVSIEQPNSPEFAFCREQSIHMSKRDELLNKILTDKQLKLVAIAGTHGKTTTTAMTVWALRELGVPEGHILPAKTSFCEMGSLDSGAELFVYEADEFDRNFLSFQPYVSIISGIDWDHPDIYPTREEYHEAFRDFLDRSENTFLWRDDADRIAVHPRETITILEETNPDIRANLSLAGVVNRLDAWIVAQAIHSVTNTPIEKLVDILNRFPGVSRRFEQIAPQVFSDYAHTPPKIRGALQLGREAAGDKLVVVYEGLHNTRQHFIKDELHHLFDGLKQLYVVPSYLAREDASKELWSPDDLISQLSPLTQETAIATTLGQGLKETITQHINQGDTVLCLSAGGGGSLDEWLRKNFA